MTEPCEIVEPPKTPAERHYLRHLEAVKKYQENHKKERAELMKEYRERIKADPEKYAKLLESKRLYYAKKKCASSPVPTNPT
jgi:hypothetical protein